MLARKRPCGVVFAFVLSAAPGALAGCRQESPPERDEGRATPDEEPSPPTQNVRPNPVAASGEAVEAIERCIGWALTEPVCRSGSDLVAFGLGEAIDSAGLARRSAASRARMELAEQLGRKTSMIRLRGTRVPRIVPCGDRQLAVAVMRAQIEAEPCPSGLAQLGRPDAEPECPEWTRGFGEATGRSFLGVGAVSQVPNEALARQTARHRAINNALSVRETVLRGGAPVRAATQASAKLSSARSVRCGGTTFVEVEVEPTAASEQGAP